MKSESGKLLNKCGALAALYCTLLHPKPRLWFGMDGGSQLMGAIQAKASDPTGGRKLRA